MKIDTSNINLSSTHAFFEKDEINVEQEVRFSNVFDNRLAEFQPVPEKLTAIDIPEKWYERTTFDGQEAMQLTHEFVLELKKLKEIMDRMIQWLNRSSRKGCCCEFEGFNQINVNPFSQTAGQVVAYDYVEKKSYTHQETENTNFCANGVVKAMDGRTIDLSFEMNLGREFFKEDKYTYHEKGYTLIDPLVINLDASLPQLAGTSFSFDMNMDGTEEDLLSLKPGSGFLALDKNEDGIINDGSELFGPSTGRGFEELSLYDEDQNMWIDENDDIFDELTIWENDDQGQMHLTKIKDAGIGAIYLAGAKTPFDLRDENNHLQARIERSGVVLNEDGSQSSIQEMDWTA